MKGSIFAAAAIVGSAMADGHLHRRHDALHQKRWASSSAALSSSSVPEETCGCTTKVITFYGSPTLVPVSTATPTPTETSTESTTTSTSTVHSTSTSTSTVTVTPTVAATSTVTPTPTPTPSTSTVIVSLPTPGVTSFSSTGTYTIPATTLTVTDTTTVCGATSTEVPSGTHTIGGVTTVVETGTVVTCPYATVKPTGSTVTSVIEYTTYTCPVAGTYTVVPGTVTTVPSSTVIVYPTPSTINPGTYTQPETTITATRTDYTYVCPYSTSLASASTPAPAPVAPTTTTVPAPATSAVAATSTSTSVPQPSSSVLTGADQYGMTFSQYTESGACMSQAEVTKNIKVIKDKGFNLVRVYSTDCNGLQTIGNACKEMGMNMILGVYIESSGASGAQDQVTAITNWAQWDLVELIVVGNEAIYSGYISAPELASFVSSAKSAFQAAGYTGRTTTAEPIEIWQEYGAQNLCAPVDIVGANIHPFYNSETTAEQAGAFALSEYKILEGICGKDVLNLETGWPNGGNPNGVAVPGEAEQNIAIHSIAQAIGDKSIFFSYANDLWKAPGAFAVEQHWGCAHVFN